MDLDWDHVKAVDIYAVLRSFLPAGGELKRVTVYPSDYGLERMAEEEAKGPQVRPEGGVTLTVLLLHYYYYYLLKNSCYILIYDTKCRLVKAVQYQMQACQGRTVSLVPSSGLAVGQQLLYTFVLPAAGR